MNDKERKQQILEQMSVIHESITDIKFPRNAFKPNSATLLLIPILDCKYHLFYIDIEAFAGYPFASFYATCGDPYNPQNIPDVSLPCEDIGKIVETIIKFKLRPDSYSLGEHTLRTPYLSEISFHHLCVVVNSKKYPLNLYVAEGSRYKRVTKNHISIIMEKYINFISFPKYRYTSSRELREL